MTEPTHRTTLALIDALRALMLEQLPHQWPDALEIQVHSLTRGRRVLSVFVPRESAAPPDATPPPRARPVLNEMERDVLQALEEAGAELTGEQIAQATGYPWDSSLRQALAALRRRGVLTGQPGERGYGIASPEAPSV